MKEVAKDGLQAWALLVHGDILDNLTNKKLNVRTGRLRAGQRIPRVEGAGSILKVFFENKVVYARIHEFGGKTRAHVIRPKDKKALRFGGPGGFIFSKKVMHPGSKIKEKKYVRDPIKVRMGELKDMIEKRVKKEIEGSDGRH